MQQCVVYFVTAASEFYLSIWLRTKKQVLILVLENNQAVLHSKFWDAHTEGDSL